MKEKTKAYAAGLLDAEGSCYIGKSIVKNKWISYNPEVRISSNHLPTLKWVVKHFGGSIFGSSKRPDEMNWQYGSQQPMSVFLKIISPYLILKNQEAVVLQEYVGLNGKSNPLKREQLVQKSRELNNRSRESVTTSTQDFLKQKPNLINAYTAGLFDGDGWVTIIKTNRSDGKPQYFRFLAIEQTSLGLAQLIQAVYGGTIVPIHPKKETEDTRYRWTLRNVEHQERFLLGVLPHLIEKRERAKVLLRMVRLGPQMCPDKRHKLWEEMRLLNQKKIKSELTGDRESAPVGTQAA